MRQRNELILGAAADGIVGVDAEGLVTFANPAAARLLGRRLEEMIGHSVENFMRPLRVGSSTELPIAATMLDGRPRQGDKTELPENGRGSSRERGCAYVENPVV